MSTALNNSKVTKAIYDLLVGDPDLAKLKFLITRAEEVNEDPNRTPWIGVYKGPTTYEPHTLGGGVSFARFLAKASPEIKIQSFSIISGVAAEEALESYIVRVFEILEASPKLNNTVAMVNGFEIDYDYSEVINPDTSIKSFFYQQATITLQVEVRK